MHARKVSGILPGEFADSQTRADLKVLNEAGRQIHHEAAANDGGVKAGACFVCRPPGPRVYFRSTFEII